MNPSAIPDPNLKKVRIKDPKAPVIGPDGKPIKGSGGVRAKRRSKKQRELEAEKNKILLKISTKKLNEDELDIDFVPEEHTILRVPNSLAPKLKELVDKREALENVKLEFQEDRKGTFVFDDKTYSTRLVDLPCIIESHKTLDAKNLYKIADISQMIVIQDSGNAPSKPMSQDEPYLWPDGITPPLKNTRKRRFRKRTTKQIGETVEAELEKLLEEDLHAIDVVYDLHEGADYDSDNESAIARSIRDELESHIDMDDPSDVQFLDDDDDDRNILRSDTNVPSGDEAEVAMSDAQSSAQNQAEEDDDDDDDDDDDTSEDEDEEDDEDAVEKARLKDTISNMEKDIEKKVQELTRITNPIIRKRFEDTIGKQRALMAEYQEQLDSYSQK